MRLPVSLLVLSLVRVSLCLTVIDGSTLQWTLFNENTTTVGSVPGGVYTDLMTGGYLAEGDFYYRYNDLNYRWVAYSNWTYTATLSVPTELANETRIKLELQGVDTVSEVKVNGVTVGNTDNMFVKYFFDITQLVKTNTEVEISVSIESPVSYSGNRFTEQAQNYTVPPECVDPQFKGECHANHIRKMQSSFSWDWGPAFPNMGIWKPLRIVGYSSVFVSDIIVNMTPFKQPPKTYDASFRTSWDLEVTVDFWLASPTTETSGQVYFSVDDNPGTISSVTLSSDADDHIFQTFLVPVGDQYDLWWPAGFGDQNLYNFTVEWRGTPSGEISSKSATIGFRTAYVDQSYVDQTNTTKGRNFRVFINNIPIFMRGSNWIPAHVLTEAVTPEYTRQLLEDAVTANQNSVRIWGGGIYESDAFYQAADELGLVVWQDMMFACSMYPSSDWFLKTVDEEVSTQIRRLNTHPSVLLYIANNENEGALRDNWYGTDSNFELYKSDYVKLYVDTVRSNLQANDPYHEVLVSSPSNGVQSEMEGYVSEWPGNPAYGDVHYYNYFSNGWDQSTYPIPRFASEYGFQSWPSFKTLSKVTSPEDWVVGSDMLEHRQHHPNGQAELDMQIMKHMKFVATNDSVADFDDYLYLTQVHQAMAVQTESEVYRRNMNRLTVDGLGHTSGALYWQLDDIWQGASWSSIEFGGRWKILHYYVKKFFNPQIVSAYLDEHLQVQVYLVNDLPESFNDVTLEIRLQRYDSLTPSVVLTSYSLSFQALLATRVFSVNLPLQMDLYNFCTPLAGYNVTQTCFVTLEANVGGSATVVPETFLFLDEPKDSALQEANISVTSVTGPMFGNTYNVSISTDNVALFVFLETDYQGYFSDNGFLMHSADMTLTFTAREDVLSTDDLKNNISIRSLRDTYQ